MSATATPEDDRPDAPQRFPTAPIDVLLGAWRDGDDPVKASMADLVDHVRLTLGVDALESVLDGLLEEVIITIGDLRASPVFPEAD